jgi:mono/diheme cytochrome c family protein
MLQARYILLAGLLATLGVAADSDRGASILEVQGCTECHSVLGRGGKTAPDLGRRIGRGYTPDTLAAAIWNHAPAMWRGMEKSAIAAKPLGREQAADLVAFLSSSRFFDKPADAGRGRRIFASHRCAECHGIHQSRAAEAPPVSAWKSLADPVALAESMWNHAAVMHEAFAARHIPWPVLTGQDLGDLLVYLRNLPSVNATAVSLQTDSAEPGRKLFTSKGCETCHTGKLDLRTRLHGKTITDISAAMWNHSPQMKQASIRFTPGEMRSLVGYLWAESLDDNVGNARRGARVFRAKRCSTCHGGEGAGAQPGVPIASRRHSPVTMISAVWNHGPTMLKEMNAKNIPWPRFDGSDMPDLISFLNSENLRRRAGVK